MTTTAEAALEVILSRRSIASLSEPGPTNDQLDRILATATTVPDHGSLKPWRFVVVQGSGRDTFGDALVDAALHHDPSFPADRHAKLRNKAFLAPTLILVIASPQRSEKVPEWEQVASASCTGYALALAAHTLGLGAVWKSAGYLSGGTLSTLLGLTASDQLLGWIAIGTPTKDDPRPPATPRGSEHTAVLDGPVLRPYAP